MPRNLLADKRYRLTARFYQVNRDDAMAWAQYTGLHDHHSSKCRRITHRADVSRTVATVYPEVLATSERVPQRLALEGSTYDCTVAFFGAGSRRGDSLRVHPKSLLPRGYMMNTSPFREHRTHNVSQRLDPFWIATAYFSSPGTRWSFIEPTFEPASRRLIPSSKMLRHIFNSSGVTVATSTAWCFKYPSNVRRSSSLMKSFIRSSFNVREFTKKTRTRFGLVIEADVWSDATHAQSVTRFSAR